MKASKTNFPKPLPPSEDQMASAIAQELHRHSWVSKVLNLLPASACVVGGFIRDIALGFPPRDIDIVLHPSECLSHLVKKLNEAQVCWRYNAFRGIKMESKDAPYKIDVWSADLRSLPTKFSINEIAYDIYREQIYGYSEWISLASQRMLAPGRERMTPRDLPRLRKLLTMGFVPTKEFRTVNEQLIMGL